MRIDAHQHSWTFTPESQPWVDDGMAVLQRDLDENAPRFYGLG